MENQNETTEEKKVTIPQFNARIDAEMKATLDDIASETGKNKTEVLAEFIRVYQTNRANDTFTDMDLSKYDNLSNPLKESVHNAFSHILNAVNGNLSTLKQEAINVESDRKVLAEKEEAYKAEIEKVIGDTNRELLTIKAECKETTEEANAQVELWRKKAIELEAKNAELMKEFDNVSKVADQVQIITDENKDLRERLSTGEASHKVVIDDLNNRNKKLEDDLAEAKQASFIAGVEGDSKDRDIETLKEQIEAEKEARADERKGLNEKLSEATSELVEVNGEYNKALGKLEILENVKEK